MDIGKNFTFVKEDPDWIKKLLFGAGAMLIGVIPVIGLVGPLAMFGYCKKLFQNAVAGMEHPLPQWDDFVGLIVDGLKAFIIMFAYVVPAILVMAPGFILPAVAGDSGAMQMVGLVCTCLGFLVYLVLMLGAGIGVMRFFATNELGQAFKIGEVLGFLKANVGQYLLALIIFGVTIFIAEIVGLILCGVGILVTIPYAQFVGWKCLADVWRNAKPAA